MIIPAAMNYYSAAEMLTKPDNNLTVIIASQMKELRSAAGSLEQDYKLPAQDHSFLLGVMLGIQTARVLLKQDVLLMKTGINPDNIL